MPVNGGYLQYYVEMEPNKATHKIILDALTRRIHSGVSGDPGYASLGFEPDIMMLDAIGLPIQQVRARFILDSLGKQHYPTELLDMSDFMLNFLENVNPAVQKQVYESLAIEGDGHVKLSDIDRMQLVRRICSSRRTIRDTEDLVMVVRHDPQLHPDISSKRADLEEWLFDFSWENGARMFRQLAKRVETEIKGRDQMRSMS
jgi:hypothetical protein